MSQTQQRRPDGNEAAQTLDRNSNATVPRPDDITEAVMWFPAGGTRHCPMVIVPQCAACGQAHHHRPRAGEPHPIRRSCPVLHVPYLIREPEVRRA